MYTSLIKDIIPILYQSHTPNHLHPTLPHVTTPIRCACLSRIAARSEITALRLPLYAEDVRLLRQILGSE